MIDDSRSALERRKSLPAAPGEMKLVQSFLNSVDLEHGLDEWESPQALADWLAFRGLLPTLAQLDGTDLERARLVREGLRSVFAAEVAASPKTRADLERALAPARARARFPAGGGIRWQPADGGLDEAFGRILAITVGATRDGAWPRFKICASPTCRTAFYDYSTNASGRWCRARCGNRISARASRRRKRRLG